MMDDVLLADAPERDRDEIARCIESHGGAIVLRVGDKIGSDAQRAFAIYKKSHDYTDPPHDFVWIGEGTLGRESSAAVVDGAGSETRSGRHETVGERQGRQLAQELRFTRRFLWFYFWWGGVMVGAGAAFALADRWWASCVGLVAGGALFSWQGRP